MGKKAKLRKHTIPAAAAATGAKIMDEQAAVTKRYTEWAQDTVAAMNIGSPKEGHQWLVDPRNKSVSEVPGRK